MLTSDSLWGGDGSPFALAPGIPQMIFLYDGPVSSPRTVTGNYRQQGLLEAIAATGKPVVLVLLSGSALAVNWANEHVPANRGKQPGFTGTARRRHDQFHRKVVSQ